MFNGYGKFDIRHDRFKEWRNKWTKEYIKTIKPKSKGNENDTK